jgi:hypothetical protein
MGKLKQRLEHVKAKRGKEKSRICSSASFSPSGEPVATDSASPLVMSHSDTIQMRARHVQDGNSLPDVSSDAVPSSAQNIATSEAQSGLMDIENDVLNDNRFKEEVRLLSNAFELKFEALRQAHQVALQKLIAEARIRNQVPIDVNLLMDRAAQQRVYDTTARAAVTGAASEIPALRALLNAVEKSSNACRVRNDAGVQDGPRA